jgi:adenylylsulfate kinase
MSKKYKGIWFYGSSGTGKSIASKYVKKLFKNSALLDGDQIRKYVSFDLGYSIKERGIQIKRVFGIAKLVKESNIFPVVSTVYMNTKIQNKLKRENILLIKILRDFNKIKNRKKIYNSKIKNVIGKDIKNPILKNKFQVTNNKTIKEFYKKISKILP